MTHHTFGKTNLTVSSLGFGSGPVGFLASQQRRITDILNLLLDSGVNLIDTAAAYVDAEVSIGNAVSHRRDQFILVSKCGNPTKDLPGQSWSADLITRSIDRSLARLKTDHLDVMLLHSCDLPTLQKGEALGALVKAQQAGKIKFAGFSGDNEAAEYAAGLSEIAVIETSINIVDQRNIDRLLPLTRKNNIGLLAKRPVANAAWRKPEEQQGVYRGYAQNYHDRLLKMNLKPTDIGLAPEDWAEMALRFTLSQEGVHCAIIGTTNPDNVRANLAIAAKGPLPAESIKKIRDAFQQADPKGEWQGLT